MSRISSTPLLLAASISTTSGCYYRQFPYKRCIHHKVHHRWIVQFNAFANIQQLMFYGSSWLVNRYAWEILLFTKAFCSVRTIWSCPITSENFVGDMFYIVLCMTFCTTPLCFLLYHNLFNFRGF